VDPVGLGLTFEALVFVTMRQEDRETLLGFEEAVTRIPNILLAQRLFGDPDYLLRIVTTGLPEYQKLQDDTLSVLPGVPRMNSTLVNETSRRQPPTPAMMPCAGSGEPGVADDGTRRVTRRRIQQPGCPGCGS
jgi:DNA-binding Lrp family transcriptional regulator